MVMVTFWARAKLWRSPFFVISDHLGCVWTVRILHFEQRSLGPTPTCKTVAQLVHNECCLSQVSPSHEGLRLAEMAYLLEGADPSGGWSWE